MENSAQQTDNILLSQLFSGALAGCISTLPMTIFMLAMHRLLPKWQKYALPPEEITRDFAHTLPGVHRIKKPYLQEATLVSHFGYGTTMGVLYALSIRALPGHPALKGTLFGLVVWAFSYLGWLPAIHSSASAYRQPVRRNALMLVAHIIWGASTGITTQQLLYHF